MKSAKNPYNGNMDNVMDFTWKRIDQLLKNNGVSKRKLSEAISESSGYLSSMKSNGHLPPADVILRICKYFDISLPQFYDAAYEGPSTADRMAVLLRERYSAKECMKIEGILSGLTEEQARALLDVAGTIAKHMK